MSCCVYGHLSISLTGKNFGSNSHFFVRATNVCNQPTMSYCDIITHVSITLDCYYNMLAKISITLVDFILKVCALSIREENYYLFKHFCNRNSFLTTITLHRMITTNHSNPVLHRCTKTFEGIVSKQLLGTTNDSVVACNRNSVEVIRMNRITFPPLSFSRVLF